MSLAEFYALVAAFLTLAVAIVVIPIYLGRGSKKKDELTNTQLVKGRLKEIQREVDEGVLSAEDKASAEQEVKVALVQEQISEGKPSQPSWIALAAGAILAIAVGVAVYFNVNHIDGVEDTAQAPENLRTLSAKLLDPDAANAIQPEDIQQLALAIRLRLREEPEDAQGWMFLGRLRTSLGQLEEAIAAYERSISQRPDNMMTRVSYAQALMMTNSDEHLRKAQRELAELLKSSPDNDNLALMMAVTSAQLGDADSASFYYGKIKHKLAADNPMRTSLEARLSELGVDNQSELANESINVTVDISESLKRRLPNDGFLLVFARQGVAQQGMPIAVKRQAISEFPISLTLGDTDAMIPELTLSSFNAVNLTARVSATADISAKPGDLEGTLQIESIQHGDANYFIKIDKEIQ